MKLERIVVGVDGSANSVAAVEWAAGLAAVAGAEVVAVHAIGLLEQARREEVERTFADVWCAPLAVAGVRCRHVVRNGSAVPVLLATADEVEADLVVVGSRGVGNHPVQLLGSTSSQVSQQANQPVVIVPSELDRPSHGRHDDVQLADGRAVEVRPLRPADTGTVTTFLGDLPPEEIPSRFAEPAGEDSTLLAVAADGTTAGVARYWPIEGTDSAEVSVVVAPAFRGSGLGRKLLVLLGVHAFERDIRRFTASYPAVQRAVTALVSGSGLPHRSTGDAETTDVEIELLPERPGEG